MKSAMGDQIESSQANLTNPGLSTANLQLKVLTNSCGANQAQQFFTVVNSGTTSIKASDIAIKFWVDDTSAANALVASLNTPGCVINAGNPSCVHSIPASRATIRATKFTPACGPDSNHQANWEIAVSYTDTYAIPAGGSLSNVQTALRLSNGANFSPGTGKWYSPCLSGTAYATDSHFSIYYQGALVASNGVTAPDCRAPHGTQQLTGHLTPAVTAAPVVGPVPAGTIIHLAVTLPMQNRDLLKTFVRQSSDPTSPNHRHYLTPDVYNANYAPAQQDYDAVVSWANANNLQVERQHGHRLIVDVSGTAANIERALYVGLYNFRRPDGSTFFAPDREPSIDLATAGLHIVGIQNYSLPKPAWAGPPHGPMSAPPLNAPLLSASDLRRMYYNCTPAPAASELDGTGQAVGIFSWGFYNKNDISTFATANATAQSSPNSNDASLYGALASNLPNQLIDVLLNGDPNQCLTNFDYRTAVANCAGGGDTGQIIETTMDIEMAFALAPKAKVYVFIMGDLPSATPAVSVLAEMAEYNGTNGRPFVGQLSISHYLNAGDAVGFQTAQDLANTMAGYGQSIFLSSGDEGGYNGRSYRESGACDPICPESFLNLDGVTVVGGTQLSPALSSGAAVYSEHAFNLSQYVVPGKSVTDASSGGGALPAATIPYYQQWMATTTEPSGGIYITNRGGSTSQRNIPDVAAMAWDVWTEESCGIACFSQPIVLANGGTSSATPIWAGYMALVNQASANASLGPVGFANPAIYGVGQTGVDGAAGNLYSQDFNDVTVGDTFTSSTRWGSWGFNTFPGYDLVTGWGSPTCALIGQLASTASARVQAVAAGNAHACALQTIGTVACWGLNDHQQLGTGSTAASNNTPQTVPSLTNIGEITSGGYHTCAMKADGSAVYCWGGNDLGQLGNGTTSTSPSPPVQVQGLSNVIHIAAGYQHTCAVVGTSPAQVKCWGSNSNGQLGNGGSDTAAHNVPILIATLPAEPVQLALGQAHTCALLADSTVACWGANSHGQLGIGSTVDHPSPVLAALPAQQPATLLAAGANHTCVNLANGTEGFSWIWCWGSNAQGQTGTNGGHNDQLSPAALMVLGSTPRGYGALAAGGNHTCAVLTVGSSGDPMDPLLACWGENGSGQLGLGNTTSPSSGYIPSLTGVLTIGLGSASSYAVISGGSIAAWGRNVEGQLGDRGNSEQDSPEMITLF